MDGDNGELPKKIEGLPVAGCRPQSAGAVAAVNQAKQVEEQVLRCLDRLAADAEIKADGRWLAVGRTAIEQGFMAVNRAVFRPERVALAEEKPVVWVLERADSLPGAPLYYAPNIHGEQWSADHRDALRFARERDAARLGAALGVAARVCEHQWS